MNNFSPNMLKTFDSCPQKYYFKYIQRISIPQKASFFEKGKKIHALAHYYLRGDEITKLETVLTQDEKEIWQSLKSNQYFRKTYVNSEYNLSCKIGNRWIGGRLDALMSDNQPSNRVESTNHSHELLNSPCSSNNSTLSHEVQGKINNDEKNYFILDYKTGSIPKSPEKDYQTMVYLLCADKFLKEYNTLNFIYIDLKNNDNYIVEFNNTIKDFYNESIKSICKNIDTYKFNDEVERSKKCEYCEYRKICI